MKSQYIDPNAYYPPRGKHAEKQTKSRSDNPAIAIAKVEKAVQKRLRKCQKNLKLLKMNSLNSLRTR